MSDADETYGLKPGDHITIHWPNSTSPAAFEMEFVAFADIDPVLTREDWRFLHGIVGYQKSIFKSDDLAPIYRTFYAHPIGDGHWEMLPRLI